MPRVPHRFANVVTAFLLSGLMSLIVSGISTLRSIGFVPELFGRWMENWSISWSTAFVVVLFVLPLVRWLTAQLVEPAPVER